MEFFFSSSQSSTDRHPEKRLKAAYDAYETENLPKLKEQHPSLRLSQLKQLLKKEWMKAPENPFHRPTVAYNEPSHAKQKQNALPEEKDSDEEDHRWIIVMMMKKFQELIVFVLSQR